MRSPLFPFVTLALVSSLGAALILTLALRQPWLGLDLAAPAEGAGVIVVAADARGPAAELTPGTRLLSIAPAGGAGEGVALRGLDLIEEPDALPTIAEMRLFFAHQGALHAVLASGPVRIETGTGSVEITPAPRRPLQDLPETFWIQIVAGLTGCWLGGWVLSLRRHEAAPTLFALAGVGLAISAYAAALYSTREIALPEGLFYWASAFNTLGALTFGVGMVSLFLVYPVRIVPRWVVVLVFAACSLWAGLAFLRLTVTTNWMIHIPITVMMTLIVLAATAQVFATRRLPAERAALRWFGLSVLLGAGSFVVLIALPQALGFTPSVKQGHAFAGFLLIYVGLAIGVARYGLFRLEDWAFRILFYVGGAALLILLDVALAALVALDRLPAFSIALLLVILVYLPARDWFAQMIGGRRRLSTEELFDLVSRVALAEPGTDQRRQFDALLTALFQPAEIGPAPAPVPRPMIRNEGEAMDLPAFDRLPAIRMRWSRQGRRLFSPRDARRAAAVMQMVAQLLERRRAYEIGAAEERRRINRDIHDNIGIQLLGALHSTRPERKDILVRQALTDLREIISNTEGDVRSLADLLADLRAELTEHLEAAGMALKWQSDDRSERGIDPKAAATLKAVLREGVNNAIRHAGASRISIRIFPDAERPDLLVLQISDDGHGPRREPAEAGMRAGQGLANLKRRTESLGGSLCFGAEPGGTGAMLTARVSLAGPERHDTFENRPPVPAADLEESQGCGTS